MQFWSDCTKTFAQYCMYMPTFMVIGNLRYSQTLILYFALFDILGRLSLFITKKTCKTLRGICQTLNGLNLNKYEKSEQLNANSNAQVIRFWKIWWSIKWKMEFDTIRKKIQINLSEEVLKKMNSKNTFEFQLASTSRRSIYLKSLSSKI
jgi:hypothetical protein